MEYEIDDDPQGTPDRNNGTRDGGVRESGIFFRSDRTKEREEMLDDSEEDDEPIDQFGEAA